MASTVSCDSGPVQALRRRGWRLLISGKCKLFVQANNPIIVDEFTTASRSLSTSSDALADMIGEVSLDKYIRKSNNDAKATDQRSRSICWAHATASVFHLASHRVVGREVPDFYTIRADLLKKFGDNDDGQSMSKVLKKACRKYRLHYLKCNEEGARTAIHARRPVIATFVLDDNHWASVGGDDGGHAVVLVRCDDTSLTFMNSWGHKFANNGFFSVDKASTLEIAGGPHVRFYDVYWTTDDISAEEITKFKAHGVNKGQKIAGALPKSFHDLPVTQQHLLSLQWQQHQHNLRAQHIHYAFKHIGIPEILAEQAIRSQIVIDLADKELKQYWKLEERIRESTILEMRNQILAEVSAIVAKSQTEMLVEAGEDSFSKGYEKGHKKGYLEGSKYEEKNPVLLVRNVIAVTQEVSSNTEGDGNAEQAKQRSRGDRKN
ncbi:hypothetical protein B0J14DRAFT_701570 [Halenospora varia]|nr:hypothetical protein B0J14DRAFT_701570 [Halenospora varia]